MNLNITPSILGLIGLTALGLGIFLILSGLRIITVQQVSVEAGSRTWKFGGVLVVLGILALWPDIISVVNSVPSSLPATQLTPAETIMPTNQPTPVTRSVLIDRYHGATLPTLDGADGARLQAKGFSFDTSTQALTNDDLAQYDVLIISFAYYSSDEFARFSDVEIATIQEYINQGGSVFLIGWGWVWSQYGKETMENYPLNKLLDSSGIFFTEYFVKNASGVSTKDAPLIFGKPNVLENHPITSGITQISGGKSVPGTLLVEQPAFPLVWGDESITDSNGTLKPIIMAASTIGKGKVVVLQHDAYIESFGDAYDNVLLLENVLGWLSEQ